jgi:hypothetical protein
MLLGLPLGKPIKENQISKISRPCWCFLPTCLQGSVVGDASLNTNNGVKAVK